MRSRSSAVAMPFSVMTTGSPLRAARRIARPSPSGLISHPIWVRCAPAGGCLSWAGTAGGRGAGGVEALPRVVLDADEGARQVLDVDVGHLVPHLLRERLAVRVAGAGGL